MLLPRLKIHPNGHFLMTETGQPFFWLADTAWFLFHRLTREEIFEYFANRRAKNFNVIQVMALIEQYMTIPNVYGERPLFDNDPEHPNPDYFARLDDYLALAAECGLYVSLGPSWADKVTPNWGDGPVVFNESNAQVYGKWLAERYRAHANLIWCLGGDRPPVKEANDWRPIWRAMAQGIRQVLGNTALITYHPDGGLESPSTIHAEPWSDFVMIQSGHWQRESPTWEWIEALFHLTPAKPALDAEPNYEDHPVAPWPVWDPSNGYFRDYEVRKQTYRAVFAGGAGITYGHHSVWQCASERYEIINHADRTWREALDRPGAGQMQHLRRLIESRPFTGGIPDQSMLGTVSPEWAKHQRAFRDSGGRYAMFYLPNPQDFTVKPQGKLGGQRLRAWWYDPRSGAATLIGEFVQSASLEFTIPDTGPDWVLVLDSAEQNFPAPGIVS
jgi:Protein of unknown function (DUF4038)/Putative collagen-binding domain of a collagenase